VGRNVTKLKNFVKYSVFILAIMTRVKYHNRSAGINIITNYASIVAKTFYNGCQFLRYQYQRYGYRVVGWWARTDFWSIG